MPAGGGSVRGRLLSAAPDRQQRGRSSRQPTYVGLPLLTDQLRANDQALLDATAPGDRATWDRLLAADAVYVDENGTIMDRATFLEELVPLPSYAASRTA